MPDAIEVILDPKSVSVTPGQEKLIGIAIRNLTSEPATYDLTLEGPAQVLSWAKIELTGKAVQAFPRQVARANLRLSPPPGSPGTTYVLSVRAIPRSRSSTQGVAPFEVIVAPSDRDIPPPPPPSMDWDTPTATDDYIVVTSPSIEVEVEEVSDAPVPPTAGQWRVWVRNAGSVITNFGFGVFKQSPKMVSVEPPELSLGPGKRASALVTVLLESGTLPGTYPFYLRTYSFLNLDERTEIGLDLVVRPPAASTPVASAPAGPLRVTVDQDYFVVDPGIGQAANLTLVNRGGQTLVPELRVAGAPPTWYTLGVSSITVPASRTVPIDVGIKTPDDVPTGSYPLSIRGQASQNAAASFRIDLLVEVRQATQSGLIQASIDNERLSVRPGVTVEARVTIRNRTQDTASVGLQLTGIDQSWFQVIPTEQLIFANQQAVAVVRIRPPFELTRAAAGIYAVPILAVSPQSPGQPGETKTELEIPLVGEPRVTLGQPDGSTVRETKYPIRVQNQTNAQLDLHFTASDTASALLFGFDQPDLSVPAGAEVTATLSAQARELATQARSLDFSVVVTGEQILRGGRRQTVPGRELAGRFVQLAAPPLNIAITPRTAKGERSEYQVRVNNPGSTPVTVLLAAADVEGPVAIELFPSELKLEGREERVAKLMARIKEKPKSRERKENPFTVTATLGPTDDVFPSTGEATLVTQAGGGCNPILGLPLWLVGLVAGLLGFLGLRGYWRQIIVIPSVIMAMLLAFVMSGGATGLYLPDIPTPWGKSIHLGLGASPPALLVPALTPLATHAPPTSADNPTAASHPGTAVPPTALIPNGATTPTSISGGAVNAPSPTGNATSTGGGTSTAGSDARSVQGSTPTANGASAGSGPSPTGSSMSSMATQANALATVTAHNYAVTDPSTYGSAGPLHVLIGAAAGGDGRSQLAYIFYDGRYLGTDTIVPSGQITFVGWKDGKTFVLRYGLYRPEDALCCPKGGTADVIYQWSDADGRIVATGQIPPTDPNAPLSRR